MWCKLRVQLPSFCVGYPVFPASCIKETMLSSLRSLGALVKNDQAIYIRINFWAFCSIGLYVCLYASIILFWLPQFCNMFQEVCEALSFFFLSKDFLAIQSPLRLHMNFRMVSYFCQKNQAFGILMRIAVILQIPLDLQNILTILNCMNILTILNLPIHEHRISFHLFVFSLISQRIISLFSACKSFALLVKFTSKYCIFDDNMNGIVFKFPFQIIHCQCLETQLTLCVDFISCNFAEFIY